MLPIGQPPFILDYRSLAITGVAVVFICMFAALLGIRRIAALEAAIVFRT